MSELLPSFYVPHGGGPCFFMDDPAGTWTGMAAFLRGLPATLPRVPRAIVCVSGHWETDGFAATASPAPPLVFDYYGFPPHTYQLTYPAPGDPALARNIVALIEAVGLRAATDANRGYDHGVFVPLKVIYPDARIPVIEVSMDRGLDPALHLQLGRALRSLREQDVLLLCAGMSFHNLRAMNDPRALVPSMAFDAWLTDAVTQMPAERATRLERWHEAPSARIAHPRHEHLLPLMVAAGAGDGRGERVYHERVLGMVVSGYRFD